MSGEKKSPDGPWQSAPSAKQKNAVHREVQALLDELAPERVLSRERIKAGVERHRTPTGCVLQAATSALSVSWFVDGPKDAPLGELRVILWDGLVTRRGRGSEGGRASVVKEMILHSIAGPLGDLTWRAADGAEFTTPSLAAHCLSLLEERIRAE